MIDTVHGAVQLVSQDSARSLGIHHKFIDASLPSASIGDHDSRVNQSQAPGGINGYIHSFTSRSVYCYRGDNRSNSGGNTGAQKLCQTERDRREDLRQRRAGEYESYIKASRETVRHAERLHEQDGENADTEWFLGESRAEYDEAYNYLVVIASDDVFLCATALHDRLSEYFDRASIDPEEIRANGEIRDLYIDLITAIRRDCFEETSLSKEQINPLLNWLP